MQPAETLISPADEDWERRGGTQPYWYNRHNGDISWVDPKPKERMYAAASVDIIYILTPLILFFFFVVLS
jgi:hypothetical protein